MLCVLMRKMYFKHLCFLTVHIVLGGMPLNVSGKKVLIRTQLRLRVKHFYFFSNLNGVFSTTKKVGATNGIWWGSWYLGNKRFSLKSCKMLIRPKLWNE